METIRTLEPALSAVGSTPVVTARAQVQAQDAMQPGSSTRIPQPTASAALGAAQRAGGRDVRFPGNDGGVSLAELAQRDLDATLQLLADRAQYITDAAGAAIALSRSGKQEMLCRASSGPSAPELGALFSTEVGLSGESVRTRQPLRCDDAQHDTRVNREICRQMGIASVLVMPVVQDDEVLGVFELFSDKASAFGERDLSALQRLGDMVGTAVRLARAAEELPERLKTAEVAGESADADILEVPDAVVEPVVDAGADAVLEASEPVLEWETETAPALPAAALPVAQTPISPPAPATPQPAVTPLAMPVPPKRPLFWSAAASASEAQKPAEADQSHVPPVLRNLRKCQACGFPVSAGRVLCVECEEKKWRGQLRTPMASARQVASAAPGSGTAARAAAAAQSAAAAPAVPAISPAAPQRGSIVDSAAIQPEATRAKVQAEDDKKAAGVSLPRAVPPATSPEVVSISALAEVAPTKAEAPPPAPRPEVVFSSGLASSQSWFGANKYILGALLVVAAVVAAIFLLR